MTPDQITQAICTAITGAGESVLEGTVAALLPVLWFAVLALHLARPYMLRTVTKFSLRLGADLWWLLYISLRDLLLVATFVMSLQFFFLDPFTQRPFPITAGFAAVCALGALVVKLLWDADDERRPFFAVSALLGLGALLYLVPELAGVQAATFGNVHGLSSALISSEHPVLAAAFAYISMGLAGALGLVALGYVLFFHAAVAADLPAATAEG